ncbi:hypothetical protein DPEC_G00346280 [Dallia pectoralis]|uniref:Uncharacterized protein n=1 Tax=Dallia pectoralis TaxID=75939 RepID=A0ACC2F3U0_DALPE|nr:hypothetical protein DPEC_G00346280 [Dallia pectoralis]
MDVCLKLEYDIGHRGPGGPGGQRRSTYLGGKLPLEHASGVYAKDWSRNGRDTVGSFNSEVLPIIDSGEMFCIPRGYPLSTKSD